MTVDTRIKTVRFLCIEAHEGTQRVVTIKWRCSICHYVTAKVVDSSLAEHFRHGESHCVNPLCATNRGGS